MNESIANIDTIRAEAQKAARDNIAPLQACRYPFGSASAALWMLEYTKTVNRLQASTREGVQE